MYIFFKSDRTNLIFYILFIYLHIYWGWVWCLSKRNSCDTCYSSQCGPRFTWSVGVSDNKYRYTCSSSSDLTKSSRPTGEQLFFVMSTWFRTHCFPNALFDYVPPKECFFLSFFKMTPYIQYFVTCFFKFNTVSCTFVSLKIILQIIHSTPE